MPPKPAVRATAREEFAGEELEILARLDIWNADNRRHRTCPFPDHEDKNPSWRWDSGKSRWFCTCGHGDVIDAIARKLGCFSKKPETSHVVAGRGCPRGIQGSAGWKHGSGGQGHNLKKYGIKPGRVATCASLHEATGLPSVATFSSGLLLQGAKVLKCKFPEARLIPCADDDDNGSGVAKARAAAEAVDGEVAIPNFGDSVSQGTKTSTTSLCV